MRAIFSGLLAFGLLAAVAGQVSAQPMHQRNGTAGPGSCGPYMYWNAGKCEDARAKPGKSSRYDDMMAKKWAA